MFQYQKPLMSFCPPSRANHLWRRINEDLNQMSSLSIQVLYNQQNDELYLLYLPSERPGAANGSYLLYRNTENHLSTCREEAG